jgi:hypothetical protein
MGGKKGMIASLVWIKLYRTHTKAQINEKRLVADICGKRALLFDRKKRGV